MSTQTLPQTADAAAAPEPVKRPRRRGSSPMERVSVPVRVLQYLALAAYLIFLAFPLVWLVSTAFASRRDLVRLHPGLLPGDPTLDNFVSAFTEQALVRSAVNSLVVSTITAVLTIVVAVPAAYALVRLRTWLTKPVLGWILVSQLFPFILLVIPIFLLLSRAGLVNTRPGLILIYVVWILPFALWMLQGYIRDLPKEVEDAASIDGASRLQTLRWIVFPLLLPGAIATMLFSFITAWNEFFFALALTYDQAKTLPVQLAGNVTLRGPRYWDIAAQGLIVMLPPLLIALLVGRYIIRGLTLGAIK